MSGRVDRRNVLVLTATLLGIVVLALWVSASLDIASSKAAESSGSAPVQSAPDLQGHIEAGDFRFGQMPNPAAKALFPLRSISLERTSCLGACPVYVMTLRRDGPATLVTRDAVNGHAQYFDAAISPELFARATQLAQAAMGTARKQEYAGQWTDDYSAIMRVESDHGSWCVFDYGQVAPVQIWAFESLLHDFRQQIDWQPSSSPHATESDPSPETWPCPPQGNLPRR
ncbi:MAG: DUF6438 domain-containing protein [Rhodanobacter sp.]|jgi:hypothetical protein